VIIESGVAEVGFAFLLSQILQIQLFVFSRQAFSNNKAQSSKLAEPFCLKSQQSCA
jgi:hypothetical protein